MYDDFDQFFCQAFQPLDELRQEFRNSPDRLKRFAAERARIFTDRWLIKPVDGFRSEQHQKFFDDSWIANARTAHYYKPDGSMRFFPSAVWIEYQKPTSWWGRLPLFGSSVTRGIDNAPDRIQPYTGNSGPDVARERFEDWVLSGRVVSTLLYQSRPDLYRLDNEYGKLDSDPLRVDFLLNNPGYEPPAQGEVRETGVLPTEEAKKQIEWNKARRKADREAAEQRIAEYKRQNRG